MLGRLIRFALCATLLVAAHSFPSQVATKPSLDSLVERVNAYWSLLLAGKKLEALEFVDREDRENFVARQTPRFSEPRVSGLELAANGTEVHVTVTVTRTLPPIHTPLEWPVREKWLFHGGKWFVTIAKGSFPFATESLAVKRPSLSPEDVERRKKAIQSVVQFQSSVLDFGTVRQGRSALLSLKYHLDGNQAMGMRFRNSPPDLVVHGLEHRKLPTGRSQSIEMELLTQNYDGRVDEVLTILVHDDQEVEVPYEFRLRGFVYTPVSVSPRVLRFHKDEREKEIIVRNNSKSEVRVGSISSQTSGFNVEPLPQTLAPGKESRLKVLRILDFSQVNYQEVLALIFSTPVEGMADLNLPVVSNYVEEKKKTIQDLTPAEIEKLIRKTKPE